MCVPSPLGSCRKEKGKKEGGGGKRVRKGKGEGGEDEEEREERKEEGRGSREERKKKWCIRYYRHLPISVHIIWSWTATRLAQNYCIASNHLLTLTACQEIFPSKFHLLKGGLAAKEATYYKLP